MNEKKDSNSKPGSDPSLPAGTSAPDPPDENPWDDDGGGRTLAQDGPSFELPSNIPSPITVPPPAPAPIPQVGRPVKQRSATMMGFGPPGPALPGQTGPGLPMGGGMGFTPAGGMPVAPIVPAPAGVVAAARAPSQAGAAPPPSSPALPGLAKPLPAMPLGGGTVQASPAPPSSPDISAASAAGGPPSSNKRPPPLPPRPGGAGAGPAPGRGAPFAATMASPVAPPAPGMSPPKVGAPAAPAPPAAPAAPAAKARPGGAVGVVSSNPPPPDDDAWPAAAQQEDGPTMAVASPAIGGRPLRDDLVNPRPVPGPPAPLPNSGRMMPSSSPMASTGYRPSSNVDKDADTMALGGGSPLLPSLDDGEVEETTRAVSREELMGHQDAQFVVGEDAMGDEATLAVAPGQIDLPQGGLAAALADSIRRESQPNMPGAPAFPPPPQSFQNQAPDNGFNNAPMGSSSGRLAAAAQHGDPGQPFGMQHQHQQPPQQQAWSGEAAPWGGEQAPPWSQPQPMSGMQQQGYDPMMPGPQSSPGMPGGYPQSGQHPLMQQQQQQGYPMQGGMGGMGGQAGYAPHPNAQTAQQPYPMGGMQGGPMMPGQPPPWMQQQQQSPQPFGGLSRAATKFTPQVILLVAVGAVCLAIFIIGIVLFVTTKF